MSSFGILFLVLAVVALGQTLMAIRLGFSYALLARIYRDTEPTLFWSLTLFGFLFATAMGAGGVAIIFGFWP